MRSTAGHLDHPLVSYPFHSFWSVMMLEAGPKERCSSGEAGSSSEEDSFVPGDNWNEKTWAKSKETEEETGGLLQAGIQTCRSGAGENITRVGTPFPCVLSAPRGSATCGCPWGGLRSAATLRGRWAATVGEGSRTAPPSPKQAEGNRQRREVNKKNRKLRLKEHLGLEGK